MDSLRLDTKQPSFFVDRFNPTLIEISPGCYREDSPFASEDVPWTHYGSFDLIAEPPSPTNGKHFCSFTIYLPANESGVPAELINSATDVISKITQLDARARLPLTDEELGDDFDFDRDNELAYVHIERNLVELRYHCTKWNNEWGAVFERNEDGAWVYTDVSG